MSHESIYRDIAFDTLAINQFYVAHLRSKLKYIEARKESVRERKPDF